MTLCMGNWEQAVESFFVTVRKTIDESRGQLYWGLGIKYEPIRMSLFDHKRYLYMFTIRLRHTILLKLFVSAWFKRWCIWKRSVDRQFLLNLRRVCLSGGPIDIFIHQIDSKAYVSYNVQPKTGKKDSCILLEFAWETSQMRGRCISLYW